jgi:hypothetical protein
LHRSALILQGHLTSAGSRGFLIDRKAIVDDYSVDIIGALSCDPSFDCVTPNALRIALMGRPIASATT